jgi:hypothetical protein
MKKIIAGFMLAGLMAGAARAEEAGKPKLGYQDTPMQPNGKWHVHDGERPQPKVVTPGTFSTQEAPGKAPSDAIVLFDGTDLSKWKAGNGQDSGWILKDGYMMVPPKGTPNGGEIMTKEEYSGDMQLHIEWSAPNPPKGNGQGRGNSGIFLMGRYELQVLDSYENPTYPDGQAGSIYSQSPPLVNATSKPGEWNVYDVVFTAPRFKDGKLESPAYITVFHNGVLLHNKKELIGGTPHRQVGKYTPHGDKGPLKMQDHGDPVRFRNIWLRELKDYDQQ